MARLGDKFAQQAKKLGSKPESSAPTEKTPASRDVLTELAISQIHSDPNQPRRDLGDLTELANSIREMGVVQPIIVSVDGYERYRIIAGERRYTASKAAGLVRIPAIVRTVEEHDRLAIQLIENLHRKDLSPFEEAETYQRLIEDFGLRQETLAQRLGKSQEAVSETLRLLTLPLTMQTEYPEAQTAAGGRISRSLLLELARRPPEEQQGLWRAVKRGDMTVRKLRAARTDTNSKKPVDSEMSNEKQQALARFYYSIPLSNPTIVVTIAFNDQVAPEKGAIISALEEALLLEKAQQALA